MARLSDSIPAIYVAGPKDIGIVDLFLHGKLFYLILLCQECSRRPLQSVRLDLAKHLSNCSFIDSLCILGQPIIARGLGRIISASGSAGCEGSS